MNSLDHAERAPLDLARDVPTTSDDVAVLRRLRREVPSWLLLTPAEFAALVPHGALDRRPATPPNARPFTLP